MVMKDMEAGKDICSFLEKKVLLFDRYLSITERMKETFKDKGPGDLRSVLSKRQDCIKRIERIDSSVKDIIEAGSNRGNHVSKKFKGVIATHLKNLKSIMERVDLIDRELMGMVKEESEGLKNELLKMRSVQQAAIGYKRGTTHPPRFLDKIR